MENPVNKNQRQIETAEGLERWRAERFGMFIHWGLYAELAGEYKGERVKGLGEWIQKHAQIPLAEYADLAKTFNPQDFDAEFIAKLAADAGMKYLAITAKHHDGFAMFHSKVDGYNIVDATPFGRDPVAELAEACARHGVTFCVYYSQELDWAHRHAYGNDWDFADEGRDFSIYFWEKCVPQLRELLTNYGPIGLVWFDMGNKITREQSMELRNLVHELQPGCLVSGRVGHGLGDYGSLGDNQLPLGTPKGDWETPATLNDSWGFKSYDHNWRDPDDIIGAVVDTAEKGVNYILNIGPDALGRVPEPSVDILRRVGDWMSRHGEAIHGTSANPFNCEFDWGRVTTRGNDLYLHFKRWPGASFMLPGLRSAVVSATILGGESLGFTQNSIEDTPVLELALPEQAPATPISVVKLTCNQPPEVLDDCCQQADGSLTLPPHLGVPHVHSQATTREVVGIGGALAAAEAAETANETSGGPRMGAGPSGVIENWFDTADYLTWTCRFLKPGTYEVLLNTMARKYQPWQGGHKVKLDIYGQTLGATITDDGRLHALRNHHFEEAFTRLGTVVISQAGSCEVSLQATHINPESQHGLCVSCLRLIPKKS